MNAHLAYARRQRGVTLIELVTSIVIVAIAVSAVLGTLTYASNSSADALVRNQSVAIASSYMEEILLKSYTPDGREASRADYDDVDDYNGLHDVGARNQLDSSTFNGVANALSQYTVDVAVTPEVLNGVSLKRVDISVTAYGQVTRLSGYRASY